MKVKITLVKIIPRESLDTTLKKINYKKEKKLMTTEIIKIIKKNITVNFFFASKFHYVLLIQSFHELFIVNDFIEKLIFDKTLRFINNFCIMLIVSNNSDYD